jgi:hypothetical protein
MPDVEGKDCDNCMFMAMIDSWRRHKTMYNATIAFVACGRKLSIKD